MGELSQWKKEAESLRHETRQTQNIQSMLDTKVSCDGLRTHLLYSCTLHRWPLLNMKSLFFHAHYPY